MNQPNANQPAPAGDVIDDGEIINFRAIKNWILFGLRSVKRRKWRVILVTLAVIGLSVLALIVIPPKYLVECRLLAQRNDVLQTRSDGQGAADPAATAADVVLSHENLLNVVKQTELVKETKARRGAVTRFKDKVMLLLGPEGSDEDKTRDMVDYLHSRMNVWNVQQVITIQLYWPDVEMAYRLVDAAQRAFLESRHVREVTTIVESLSILEGHAAELARQVDQATLALQSLREKKKAQLTRDLNPKAADEPAAAAAHAGAPAGPRPAPVEAPPTEESLEKTRRMAELPVLIDAKRKLVDDMEGTRRRRLAELQAKLEEQSATYTEAHPAVADVKQQIAVANKESPQVAHLRQELGGLEGELERLTGVKAGRRPSGFGFGGLPITRPIQREAALQELQRETESDPELEVARTKLKFTIDGYQDVQERIRVSRVELDTAQAAFKYRYVLVTPPEMPRGPASPKPPLILAIGLLCGIMIGMIAAIGRELREGIITERWQIEQILSVPVLTDVHLPALPAQKT